VLCGALLRGALSLVLCGALLSGALSLVLCGAQRSGDWGPQKRGAQSESLKLMLGTNPKAAGEGARV
jgi:hypothetical protein